MVKKRNIALIAAGALGIGTIAATQIDRHYNLYYATNTAYCTIRNALLGTEGEADISIELCYENSLTRKQAINSRAAFENAREEYRDEFNIVFRVMSEKTAESKDECLENNADISLFFVPEIPDSNKADAETTQGLANRRDNSIIIAYSQYRECLESTLLHEFGHMFYAEHSNNPDCVMFHHRACFRFDNWCDDEKAVITKYKHRFW
ncbi:MAG: hypothetical protein PHO02_05990 [Candidatus Nanoarchaeia archaeon]|nr:hypothetical protein [Candidatus Nanoarchaeia archaeon]